jgi:hypothetical protein
MSGWNECSAGGLPVSTREENLSSNPSDLSPPAVFFMGLFDGHDLKNPDQVIIIRDLVENCECTGDMNTVYAIVIWQGEKFTAPWPGVFPQGFQGVTGGHLQFLGELFQKIEGFLVNFDPVHGL